VDTPRSETVIGKLIDRLIARARRTPYQHIGDYMERWWLIPYSRFGIACRLHHILKSDDDRAFHDHPWPYLTVVLRGGYTEVKPRYDRSGFYLGESRRWYGPGSVIFRRAKSWHRLEIPPGASAWTMFISGPKRQSWGFLPHTTTKIYWREYLNDWASDERVREDLDE
jgi:hypothetical protein